VATDPESLVRAIGEVQFTPVRFREGYTMSEVDAFLERVVAAVRSGEPIDELVRTVQFTPVRLAEGYLMGEVDDFLDRVLAAGVDRTPSAYVDAPPSPVSTTPVAATPSVIQEQRGLLARLFKR
jgi:DivIVA domain-containing protein